MEDRVPTWEDLKKQKIITKVGYPNYYYEVRLWNYKLWRLTWYISDFSEAPNKIELNMLYTGGFVGITKQ